MIRSTLGGTRSPASKRTQSSTRSEEGAVLVAAVGNSDEAPQTPWPYASYPAALPHVIGVSALTPTGNVPAFSDRDRIYNDVSAPGQEIYSTLPRVLTSFRPLCQNQGYSDCGPDEFRHAAGTSFAAPQVTAAAALLFALKPTLQPDQVDQHHRAFDNRRERVERLQAMPPSARHVQRLGPARRRQGDRRSRRRDPSAGPTRAQRRRRFQRRSALGPGHERQGDDRLLGRPDRRLPDLPAQGAARQADAQRARGNELEPPPLASRDEAGRRSPQPAPARRPGDRTGRVAQARAPGDRHGLVLRSRRSSQRAASARTS